MTKVQVPLTRDETERLQTKIVERIERFDEACADDPKAPDGAWMLLDWIRDSLQVGYPMHWEDDSPTGREQSEPGDAADTLPKETNDG